MGNRRSTTLQPPSGGSTYDPMIEARVASLEADVKNIRETIGEMKIDLREVRSDLNDLRAEVRSDISELKVNVATLTERVAHLPTKGYIGWWITLGLSAAVAALTILSRLGFLVAK
jgi:hypothetical protein